MGFKEDFDKAMNDPKGEIAATNMKRGSLSFADAMNHGYENQDIRSKMPSWQTQDLSQSNALPWQKYTPQELIGSDKPGEKSGLATDILNRVNTPGYAESTLNKNVNENPFSVAHGSLGDPISGALNKKYSSLYDTKMSGLNNQQDIKKSTFQSNELGRAGKIFGNQWQNQVQNYKEQVAFQQQRQQMWQQWKNAKDQAGGSFLSSVLGVVGTIFGGPVGGAIGGAIGSIFGKSGGAESGVNASIYGGQGGGN